MGRHRVSSAMTERGFFLLPALSESGLRLFRDSSGARRIHWLIHGHIQDEILHTVFHFLRMTTREIPLYISREMQLFRFPKMQLFR